MMGWNHPPHPFKDMIMKFTDVIFVCAEAVTQVNVQQHDMLLHKMLDAFQFVEAITLEQRHIVESTVEEYGNVEDALVDLLNT